MQRPAFFDDDGPGGKPLLGWTAAVLWLLAVGVVLGTLPLTAEEASLLPATSAPPDGISPLYGLLLRAVADLGPPAELLLRLLGLAGLPLMAFALYRLCADLGGPSRAEARPTGRLVALCCGCHGAALLVTARLGPGGLFWGALALLLLAFVGTAREEKPPPTAAGALAATGLLSAAVEPLALPCIIVLAAWLWRARQQTTAAAALALPATLAVGLFAALGWATVAPPASPDLFALACSAAGIGPNPALVQPGEGFLAAAAPVVAVGLACLAAAGVRSVPKGVVIPTAGLLATALAVTLFRDGSVWNESQGALLVPPLLLLGSWRLASLPEGRRSDRILWLCLVMGVSAVSGLGVLATYRHADTRGAARALAGDEEPAGRRDRLTRAISFYRPAPPPRGAAVAKQARIWHPGDRRPRKVLVEAYGDPVGQLWITRPKSPVYDLGAELARASVTYTEAGRDHRCYWQARRSRFACNGPDYLRAMWSFAEFDGVEADAILVHPLDDGVLELRWTDVPLGGGTGGERRKLFGLAGLDDRSLAFSRSPVTIEIRVGDGPPVKIVRGSRPGLRPFEIDTSHAPERADIVFRITTEDDRGRHLFIDALVL